MRQPVHILMVDDNPADIDLVREALGESQRPFRLESLADGEAALSLMSHSPEATALPDLMLLDLNLPRQDGRRVLAEMKADPQLANIPVVIFTTSQAKTDVRCSYELGANCYLRKPGTLTEFRAAVHCLAAFWLGHVTLPPKEN
jgi:two-component system, chemotaxis family, response regulator Rcp1